MRNFAWESISFWDKYRLFNKWSVVSAIGNLLTIFGSIFYICNKWFPYYQAEHFLGFGCFLTWISITRYINHTKDYALIHRTFSLSIPLVLKVMLGWLPIFIGFALLGVCLFWPFRDYFDSLPNAMFSLYACMNGDSVGDIFTGTTKSRLMLGQIFVYTFTIFSMCILQNINFILVEDSYLTAKYSSSFDWLKNGTQKPKEVKQQQENV